MNELPIFLVVFVLVLFGKTILIEIKGKSRSDLNIKSL